MKHVIFIFILITQGVFAQQELMNWQLTNEDGLASNKIYSVFQSTDGHLYICQPEGLFRYNGKDFINIQSAIKKPIKHVVEDKNGLIWAISFKGDIYFIQNDWLHTHPINKKLQTKEGSLQILAGEVFLISGLRAYHLLKNDSEVLFDGEENQLDQIYGIWEMESKHIICQKGDSILIINIDSKETSFLCENAQDNVKCNFSQYKLSLLNLSSNTLLEIKQDHFSKAESQIEFDFTPLIWTGFKVLNEGGIIAYGLDGFVVFNAEGVPIQHSLKGFKVSDVLQDSQNRIWASTLNSGVFIFPLLDFTQRELSSDLKRAEKINSSCKISDQSFVLGSTSGRLVWVDDQLSIQKEIILNSNAEIQSIYYNKVLDKLFVSCDGLYEINNRTKQWS